MRLSFRRASLGYCHIRSDLALDVTLKGDFPDAVKQHADFGPVFWWRFLGRRLLMVGDYEASMRLLKGEHTIGELQPASLLPASLFMGLEACTSTATAHCQPGACLCHHGTASCSCAWGAATLSLASHAGNAGSAWCRPCPFYHLSLTRPPCLPLRPSQGQMPAI